MKSLTIHRYSSILGMSLFGGSFCEKPDGTFCTCAERRNKTSLCVCDRANFDNLVWSIVTVFQVSNRTLRAWLLFSSLDLYFYFPDFSVISKILQLLSFHIYLYSELFKKFLFIYKLIFVSLFNKYKKYIFTHVKTL